MPMVSRESLTRPSRNRLNPDDGSMSSSPLSGCLLVIHGEEKEDEQDLRRIARLLGARMTKLTNLEVTHVISEDAVVVSSEKAQIIVPAWLRACEAAGKRVPEAEYRVPTLQGLEVVPSGLSLAEKEEMQRVAERCGAIFTRGLARSCTHLVTAQPTGRKYEFARNHGNIAIVTPRWLFESAGAGRRLNEQLYRPGADPPPVRERNVSVQQERSGGEEDKLEVVTVPMTSKSPVRKEITNVKETDVKTVPNTESSARTGGLSGISGSFSDLSLRPSGRLRRPRTKPPSLLLDSVCMYLTSCPKWNSTVHATLRARTLRIAACAGAAISPRWTASVNTVVVVSVPILAEQIKSITEAELRGVRVVGISWLEKCVEAGKIFPISAAPIPEWKASAAASASQSQSLVFPFGDRGISSQPMPTSTVFLGARVSLGPLALRDPDAVAIISAEIAAGRGKVLPHNESGLVISGVPTHVMCPKSLKEAETAVVTAIRTQNARVICVTPMWSQSCIAEKCLLPVRLCVLFSPIQRLDIPEMNSLSITITGFQQVPAATDWNRRRTTLATLIQLLGAKFQQRMRRRTSVLIADDALETVSDKVTKARVWNIPVVSHMWLLACAAQGRVIPYGMHTYKLAPKPPRAVRPRSHRDSSQHNMTFHPSQPAASQLPTSQALASQPMQPAPMPDLSTITLFNKFTSTMRKANNINGEADNQDDGLTMGGAIVASIEESRRRSRSVSLDAHDWDDGRDVPGSASQSQVIVHRDLTPPPSPKQALRRSRRTLPPRSAKAKRARLDF